MDKPYEFALKVAKKLRYLRKLHHLSQQEVANRLYMAQTTYSKYERGCLIMNGTLAKQIANMYNISVSYLLDDEQEDILITIDQYKTLIKARNAINEIEKSKEKSKQKEIEQYSIPKTRWKTNTKEK